MDKFDAAARLALLALCALVIATPFAVDAQVSEPQGVATPPIATATGVPVDCHCLPAGTVVQIEIGEAISSAERKPGDEFKLRLAQPVQHNGVVLIPAGVTGTGQIVHAAPSHGGGTPGELLLAARFLDVDGRRIPLRGMKLGVAGKDESRTALAASVAIGAFALFIHGREVVVPAGTVAEAKLAQPLPDDPSAATPIASQPAPSHQE